VIVSDLQGLKIGRSTQAVSLRIRSEYSAKSVYLPMAIFVLPNLTSFDQIEGFVREIREAYKEASISRSGVL